MTQGNCVYIHQDPTRKAIFPRKPSAVSRGTTEAERGDGSINRTNPEIRMHIDWCDCIQLRRLPCNTLPFSLRIIWESDLAKSYLLETARAIIKIADWPQRRNDRYRLYFRRMEDIISLKE